MNHVQEKNTIYLILGDGDFSFSLDMARYLLGYYQQQQQQQGSRTTTEATSTGPASITSSGPPQIRLVATGIDSLEELTEKYRDAPHILSRLKSLNDKEGNFHISAHHGVNAIQDSAEEDKTVEKEVTQQLGMEQADRCIFNHPHLGTEDAALHTRFLFHLFHSVVHVWLRPGRGLFHLTLAKGQYERWNGARAADQQAMILVDRRDFISPPVAEPCYEYRRHQTGKSFGSRILEGGGSETLTFARAEHRAAHPPLSQVILPWFLDTIAIQLYQRQPLFPCPHCDKGFREERSLKNHVGSKHASVETATLERKQDRRRSAVSAVGDKKRKVDSSLDAARSMGWSCPHCQRELTSPLALDDHVRAKHTAIHTLIVPDWTSAGRQDVVERQLSDKAADGPMTNGQCAICGLDFHSPDEQKEHLRSFQPKSASIKHDRPDELFVCQFCSKCFRQRRSQLQHENFCKLRPQQSSD